MPRPLLVSVADLGKRLGRTLTGAKADRAEAVIEDLSGDILAYTGCTWDEATLPGDVRRVLFAAALREYRNPDRFTTEEKGPIRGVRAQSAVTPDAFTPQELAVLSRYKSIPGLHTLGSERKTPYTVGADSGEWAWLEDPSGFSYRWPIVTEEP